MNRAATFLVATWVVVFGSAIASAPAPTPAVAAVRDPFERPARVDESGNDALGTQLRLAGIMHSPERSVALLEDATGVGLIVEPGATLPTKGLRVLGVESDFVRLERIDGGSEIVVELAVAAADGSDAEMEE